MSKYIVKLIKQSCICDTSFENKKYHVYVLTMKLYYALLAINRLPFSTRKPKKSFFMP